MLFGLSAKSDMKTSNMTVNTYFPNVTEEDGVNDGCHLPLIEHNSRTEFRFVESNRENTTNCIIIDWTVDNSSAESIIGYILEITQSSTGTCRLIWIPCVDCFPGYDLVSNIYLKELNK